MSLWTIIPVKPLNRAKSRLADVLTAERRYEFAESMLRRVLAVVTEVPHITGVLVISRDTKALAIARDAGAKTIQETSPSELNPALLRATEIVRAWGARAILILPADLPFIQTNDIVDMVELGAEDPSVVIVTDRNKDGTNAMLVRPPGLIDYAYGPGSFQRHLRSARIAGADVRVYESERLLLDIDVPEDLVIYNQLVTSEKLDILLPFLPDTTS